MADEKIKVATTWLDGCSGCHMSLLDIDEALLAVTDKIQIVYGPLVDIKKYPEHVDVALVEGAVSSDEDEELVKEIRANTHLVISLGDCAVTSNVPAMRNPFPIEQILERAYVENVQYKPSAKPPTESLPRLLRHSRPLHEVIDVDFHLPGCPPPAAQILEAISSLLEGRMPDLGQKNKFG